MLFRLRFPPLGCCDNEDAGINGTYTGEHVLNKPDVSRNVNEGQLAA